MFSWHRYLAASLLLFLGPLLVASEPVQYCRFGDPAKPNQDADFCLGLTTQRNASTNAHNVYITFTHTRRHSSSLGWTAVGVGQEMKGSLMFIVYGDPLAAEDPIVSIRSVAGHHQPELLAREAMAGGDLRVLSAEWHRETGDVTGTVTAVASIVCYSCTLWPGTELSATSKSQPWIWAWNKAQEFDLYEYDAHLRMHAHHAGNGGWGRFYVDMARAESHASSSHLPSMPVIRKGVSAVGASDGPDLLHGDGLKNWITQSPVLRLHGFFMILAFAVLFPSGVVAMRSGSPKSFKYHWILQVVASASVLGGAAAGWTLSRHISTTHQILGLTITGALFLQAFLGWKHHVDFVRIRRRTWISHAHIWTGRSMMAAGLANIVLGLVLRGYSRAWTAGVGVFLGIEALLLVWWVWRRQRFTQAKARHVQYETLDGGETRGNKEWAHRDDCFAVSSDVEDDSDESSEAEQRKSGESHPLV